MVKKILKKKTTKRKGGNITKLRKILEDIDKQIDEVNDSNDDDKELQLLELEENKKEIEKEIEELYNAQEKESINDYKINEYLEQLDEINREITEETDNISKSRLIKSRANIIESLKELGHHYEPSIPPPPYQPPPPPYQPPTYQPPPSLPPQQQVYKFIPPFEIKSNDYKLNYTILEFRKISDLIDDTDFRISISLYNDIFLIKDIDMKSVGALIRDYDGSIKDNTSIPIKRAIGFLSQMNKNFIELLKIMDYIINTLKYDSYDKLSRNDIPNTLLTYLGCRIHDFKYILKENKDFNKANKHQDANAFATLLEDKDKQISFDDSDRKTLRNSNCGRYNIDYFKGGVRKLKSYA